jgi:hypothetical protein
MRDPEKESMTELNKLSSHVTKTGLHSTTPHRAMKLNWATTKANELS